jgi:hypothetical protein
VSVWQRRAVDIAPDEAALPAIGGLGRLGADAVRVVAEREVKRRAVSERAVEIHRGFVVRRYLFAKNDSSQLPKVRSPSLSRLVPPTAKTMSSPPLIV